MIVVNGPWVNSLLKKRPDRAISWGSDFGEGTVLFLGFRLEQCHERMNLRRSAEVSSSILPTSRDGRGRSARTIFTWHSTAVSGPATGVLASRLSPGGRLVASRA